MSVRASLEAATEEGLDFNPGSDIKQGVAAQAQTLWILLLHWGLATKVLEELKEVAVCLEQK